MRKLPINKEIAAAATLRDDMKYGFFLLIANIVAFSCASAWAVAEHTRIENFKQPPSECRPLVLWFWNAPMEIGHIQNSLDAMKQKCGYGGVGIIPATKSFAPEYLGDAYLELYKETARYAEAIGLRMSLYDEYGFPSGNMGGNSMGDGAARFRQRHPESTLKRLDMRCTPLFAGAQVEYKISNVGKLMALTAVNADIEELERTKSAVSSGAVFGFGRDLEIIPLSKDVKDGILKWRAPASGKWTLLEFYCVTDGDANADYLDRAATEKFVGDVHAKYFEKMPQFFGGAIKTAFFDEPTLYRCVGRVWTNSFNEEFFERCGANPEVMYPALFFDVGKNTASYRNALFKVRADLYAEFFKPIDDWCAARGVMLTGHQDNEERANPVGTSADLMKAFKHVRIPGIDKIGGARPAERFYRIVSSAAYNFDRGFVMSETFGAMDCLPIELMYEIALDQYACGINMLILHAVWADEKKILFKPDLGGNDAYYSSKIKVFNEFLARLNAVLQNEDRVYANVAVLYPIETMQAEFRFDGPLTPYEGGVPADGLNYVQTGAVLENLGASFMWLHPETLAEKCSVADGKLRLENKIRHNEFGALILPDVKVASLKVMRKVLDFAKAGGAVVCIGARLPYASGGVAAEDAEIARLSKELSACRNFLQTDLAYPAVLGGFLAKRISAPALFDGQNLKYIRKISEGKSTYFIANISGKKYGADITLAGRNFIMLNPMTGEISKIADAKESELILADGSAEIRTSFRLDLENLCGAIFTEE